MGENLKLQEKNDKSNVSEGRRDTIESETKNGE